MEESFSHYQVIETKDMSAEQLQEVLNKATTDFPKKQIDYVIGTKIILGYESFKMLVVEQKQGCKHHQRKT